MLNYVGAGLPTHIIHLANIFFFSFYLFSKVVINHMEYMCVASKLKYY